MTHGGRDNKIRIFLTTDVLVYCQVGEWWVIEMKWALMNSVTAELRVTRNCLWGALWIEASCKLPLGCSVLLDRFTMLPIYLDLEVIMVVTTLLELLQLLMCTVKTGVTWSPLLTSLTNTFINTVCVNEMLTVLTFCSKGVSKATNFRACTWQIVPQSAGHGQMAWRQICTRLSSMAVPTPHLVYHAISNIYG